MRNKYEHLRRMNLIKRYIYMYMKKSKKINAVLYIYTQTYRHTHMYRRCSKTSKFSFKDGFSSQFRDDFV